MSHMLATVSEVCEHLPTSVVVPAPQLGRIIMQFSSITCYYATCYFTTHVYDTLLYAIVHCGHVALL